MQSAPQVYTNNDPPLVLIIAPVIFLSLNRYT